MLTLLKTFTIQLTYFRTHVLSHPYTSLHTHLEWYNTLHIYTIQVNNTCKVGHNNKCKTLYKVGPKGKNSGSLNWLGIVMHSVEVQARSTSSLGQNWFLSLPWTLGKHWLLCSPRSLGKHWLLYLPWSLGKRWWLGEYWELGKAWLTKEWPMRAR